MGLSRPVISVLLRALFTEAVAESVTLQAKLTAYAIARISTTDDPSKELTGSATAGVSVNFSLIPGVSKLDFIEAADFLLRLYDEAHEALVSAGDASPTDSEIYTEMLDRLAPTRATIADFSCIREPISTDTEEVVV